VIMIALCSMAFGMFVSAGADAYRDLKFRIVGVETVAVVRQVSYRGAADDQIDWALEFPWEGGPRTSWTTDVVGKPAKGDLVTVLVDPDDTRSVVMQGWGDRNLVGVFGRIGIGLLLVLGVVLMLRHQLRKEPEPVRTTRPKKPRTPRPRRRRGRRR
jgi:hypothetical protein